MRPVYLIAILLLSLLTNVSRGSCMPDSLAVQLPDTTYFQNRPKPTITWAFNLDFRNSIIEKEVVNVWGINSGIQFGRKRHQLTVGYYWLTYATHLRLINWKRDAAQRINLGYYTKTDLWFANLLYWPNIINNRRWVLSTPVEIGAGKAYSLSTDLATNEPLDRTRRDFFVPVQVGVYGQWKATRWVGFSTQVGYRYSIIQTDINSNFNGPYYSFGATVFATFWKDLWRAVRHKERISPFRPPVAP
jgi:hypothetical protein